MRKIECDLQVCGQATYLIDEKYTLDKGWAAGTDISTAPYYVCPNHVSRYTLTPMPSAVLAAPEPPPAAESPEPDG